MRRVNWYSMNIKTLVRKQCKAEESKKKVSFHAASENPFLALPFPCHLLRCFLGNKESFSMLCIKKKFLVTCRKKPWNLYFVLFYIYPYITPTCSLISLFFNKMLMSYENYFAIFYMWLFNVFLQKSRCIIYSKKLREC